MLIRATAPSNFKHDFAFSRHDLPEVCLSLLPKKGAGNAGCALHPRSRVQICAKEPHTSIQVQRKHSGIPRAMALRLMARSPRRRIRLVTVAAGLMAETIRLDRTSHRQLDTSNGCQDHTVLPYALASFVLRTGIAHERLALRSPLRADAVASTTSSPAFRDDRDTPLLQGKDGRDCIADLPDGLSEIFLRAGLDDPNHLEDVR